MKKPEKTEKKRSEITITTIKSMTKKEFIRITLFLFFILLFFLWHCNMAKKICEKQKNAFDFFIVFVIFILET